MPKPCTLSTIIELPSESLKDSPLESPLRSSTPHPESGEVLLPDGSFLKIEDRNEIIKMKTSGKSDFYLYVYLRSKGYPSITCREALSYIKHSSDPDYEGSASAASAPAAREPKADDTSSSSVADSASYRDAADSGYSTEHLGVSDKYDSDGSD